MIKISTHKKSKMATPMFNFHFLSQHQSQKEIIINENFNKIGVLFNRYVKSLKITTPKELTTFEHIYIVSQTSQDEWAQKENCIAYYQDGWKFITPQLGMIFFIYDEKCFYGFTGKTWEKFT